MAVSQFKEKGRKEFHPKDQIEESIRGVEFDFYYTGKRLGSSQQVELHVTSVVRDWEENIFVRKSWYRVDKNLWQICLKEHVRQHLQDLCTGRTFIMSLLRDFHVKEENFREWEKYDPVYFNNTGAQMNG